MNRICLCLTLVVFMVLAFANGNTFQAHAQRGGKTGKTPIKAGVYICKTCKTFSPVKVARKQNYKDMKGHTLLKARSAPKGYVQVAHPCRICRCANFMGETTICARITCRHAQTDHW